MVSSWHCRADTWHQGHKRVLCTLRALCSASPRVRLWDHGKIRARKFRCPCSGCEIFVNAFVNAFANAYSLMHASYEILRCCSNSGGVAGTGCTSVAFAFSNRAVPFRRPRSISCITIRGPPYQRTPLSSAIAIAPLMRGHCAEMLATLGQKGASVRDTGNILFFVTGKTWMIFLDRIQRSVPSCAIDPAPNQPRCTVLQTV